MNDTAHDLAVHAMWVWLIVHADVLMLTAATAILAIALRLVVLEFRRPIVAGEDAIHASFFYDLHRALALAAGFWTWGAGSVWINPQLASGIGALPLHLRRSAVDWFMAQEIDLVLGSVFMVGACLGLVFFVGFRWHAHRDTGWYRHVYVDRVARRDHTAR